MLGRHLLVYGAWHGASHTPGKFGMSKVFFFMKDIDTSHLKDPMLPDVYCPKGGYFDANMDRRYESKGEKFRHLRSKGMREAEVFNPGKSLGGTEGCARKTQGRRGNFASRPMPDQIRRALALHG